MFHGRLPRGDDIHGAPSATCHTMCAFSQLVPVLAAVAAAIKLDTTMDDQCPVVGDTGTGGHRLRTKLIPNSDGSESASPSAHRHQKFHLSLSLTLPIASPHRLQTCAT